MEKPTLPAARQLADDVRALYAQGLEETELWQEIASAMRMPVIPSAATAAGGRGLTTLPSGAITSIGRK